MLGWLGELGTLGELGIMDGWEQCDVVFLLLISIFVVGFLCGMLYLCMMKGVLNVKCESEKN